MKRLYTLIAAIMMACLLSLPAVVRAQDDEVATTDVVKEAREAALARRKDKQTRMDAIKAEVAARKLMVKEKVCEKREARLNASIPRLSRAANNIKSIIDKHYDRVQDFYASGQLTTPDYDELVAAIELAKANAEASLETLASFTFEVDCANENVGEQLDGFRTAINQIKTDLKNYRKSVVDLISALKSANARENRDSAGETSGDIVAEEGDTTDTEEETETETEQEEEVEQ